MQHVHHRLVASLGNGCSTALEEPDIRREGLRRHNWLFEKHHALPQPLAALLAEGKSEACRMTCPDMTDLSPLDMHGLDNALHICAVAHWTDVDILSLLPLSCVHKARHYGPDPTNIKYLLDEKLKGPVYLVL